jgi:archaellum biogenesis protein FlaJ (TadC family)
MVLPGEPVALSPDQVLELNMKLSKMRHDINNSLCVMVTAMELMRTKPESVTRMLASLADQPGKIDQSVKLFSKEFEQTFGITRAGGPV